MPLLNQKEEQGEQKVLKPLHKFILVLFLFYFLGCTSCVLAVEETSVVNKTQNQMELVQKDVKVNDLDIEPINTSAIKNDVVPDTKKEAKKVLMLFIKAMFIVTLCAGLTYLGFLYAKKYHSEMLNTNEPKDFDMLDLATPQDKQDALKSFLKRSKTTRAK